MIPIHSFDQFTRHDGWLSDARPTHGFKLAETKDKSKPPRSNSILWSWEPVHRTEVTRMKQAYKNPDLTDPIRCSYLTLTTKVNGREAPLVIDVEPCRVFHDQRQMLHTLWLGKQEGILDGLRSGRVGQAIGLDMSQGYRPDVEQVYYDGRYLYRLPWAMDAELTDEFLRENGARPVNADKNLWMMQVSVVALSAVQDWENAVPRDNSSVMIYRSTRDNSVWGHTPPLSLMSLTTTANLMVGDDGMDDLDRDLRLNLDFALDAARIIGKWCGPAAVDALELPRAMLKLNTVNLSNLHPSERALTPIAMGFSQASIWLMGRSLICETPEQCLDFRSLYTDLYMRRTCMSENRIMVRRSKNEGQPIPLMEVDLAARVSADHVSKREKARLKRSAGLQRRAKAAAAEKAREHAEKLGARRSRRGRNRNRMAAADAAGQGNLAV